jgi:dUTP pyrophosphatase
MSERVTQDEKDMLCNYPQCKCPIELHQGEPCVRGRQVAGAAGTIDIPPGKLWRPVVTGTRINVKKLRPNAVLPTYAHDADGCFDIYTTESGYLPQQRSGVFATGLAFEIPVGYVMLVFSRSGMGFGKGVRLVNSVGVIDSGYHKELMVGLHNDSTTLHTVHEGDRIAQAMIIPRPKIAFSEVTQFDGDSRASEGFGGSGK